jgi:tape measure domain-containing protein
VTDVHNIQIKVDASQGKRELSSFNTTLGQTAKALNALNVRSGSGFDRLSQQVTQLAAGFQALKSVAGIGALGKDLSTFGSGINSIRAPSSTVITNISSLAKALNNFGKVTIPKGVGAEMQALGAGLAAIKPPNLAAIQRIPAVIKELSKAGNAKIGTAVAADIATLSNAFASFRAPSAAAGPRIIALLNSLKGARINPNISASLGTLGTAFSNFRAPSAAAATNIGRLIQVLGTGNSGQVAAMANALQRISGIAVNVGNVQRATQQRAGAGGGAGGRGPGWLASISTGANGATGALRGLENQFSATYHIASLLRTAMGSLTLGALVTGVTETGRSFQSLQRGLESVAASSTETQSHMAFLNDLTTRLPISLETAATSYRQFGISAREAGISVGDTQKIFAGFGTAFSGIGLDADKQKLAFMAVEQIITKGKFAMQELRQQLGNELPGVMSVLAQSMGVSIKELEKQLEAGLPAEKLIGMADLLEKKWAPAVASAMQTGAGQAMMFQNTWTRFKATVFDNGFDRGMAQMFKSFNEGLNGDAVEAAGKKIGAAFQEIFVYAGALGQVLIENRETVLQFGLAFAAWATITAGVSVLKMLASPLLLITALIGPAGTMFRVFGLVALAALSPVATLRGGIAGLALAVRGLGASMLGVPGLIAALGFEAGRIGGELLNKYAPDVANMIAGARDKLVDAVTGSDASKAAVDLGKEVGNDFVKGLGVVGSELKSGGGALAELALPDTGKLMNDSMAAVKSALAGLTGLDLTKVSDPFDAVSKAIDKAKASVEKLKNEFHGDYVSNAERDTKKLTAATTELSAAEEKLFKSLQPWRVALEKAKTDFKTLEGLSHLTAGPNAMDPAKIDQLKQIYAYKNLPAINPFAGEVRSLTQELELSKLTGNAREEETKFIGIKNALLEKGVVISAEQEQTLRRMIQAQMELSKGGSNGFQQWANGVKDLKDALADVEKNGVEGLSSALSDLVVKGKADFVGSWPVDPFVAVEGHHQRLDVERAEELRRHRPRRTVRLQERQSCRRDCGRQGHRRLGDEGDHGGDRDGECRHGHRQWWRRHARRWRRREPSARAPSARRTRPPSPASMAARSAASCRNR